MRFYQVIFPLVFFVPLSLFSQYNIYVDTLGNDVSGTGTISNPFKTITKAADVASAYISGNPTTPVDIWVRGGVHRNSGFTTHAVIDPGTYDPVGAGEAIWKQNNAAGTVARINNVHGNANAWITVKPYGGEHPIIHGDGDIAFSIRNSSYVKVTGLEIKGVLDKLPELLAWKYWGTYRYLVNGSFVYDDRKEDICTEYGISPCTDIPPNIFPSGSEYEGLPNINNLNVERPNIFGGKGLVVQLSHHINIESCDIYNFPGGGLRVTQSDYIDVIGNDVHHNSSRASVGTHGMVAEGLTPESGNNSSIEKMKIAHNRIYSNYNEIYSWVQSKTIVTTHIDEGKGLALLRTSPTESGFNGIIRVENNLAWDNGKSGIHTNDVAKAEIYNNTVFSNGHTNVYNAGITGGTNAGISIQSSTDIKIVNNIAVVPDGLSPQLIALAEGQNCTGEVVTNNLVWGGGTSDFPGGYTVGNPLFTDMDNNDVTLQTGSPAINAGTSTNMPTIDFLFLTRNSPPEIGAYEFFPPAAVELLQWGATLVEEKVSLEWICARERGNHGFEIERSNDAQHWAYLDYVVGKGDSDLPTPYNVFDHDPQSGINYYRLIQQNENGDKWVSPIISVTVNRLTSKILIWPNPFVDQIRIVTDANAESVPISVTDQSGRPISFKIQPAERKNAWILDLSQTPGSQTCFLQVGDHIFAIFKR